MPRIWPLSDLLSWSDRGLVTPDIPIDNGLIHLSFLAYPMITLGIGPGFSCLSLIPKDPEIPKLPCSRDLRGMIMRRLRAVAYICDAR